MLSSFKQHASPNPTAVQAGSARSPSEKFGLQDRRIERGCRHEVWVQELQGERERYWEENRQEENRQEADHLLRAVGGRFLQVVVAM